jgi:hypothetical protein
MPEDLIAAALRRGLLADPAATRADLEKVCSVILQEAMKR